MKGKVDRKYAPVMVAVGGRGGRAKRETAAELVSSTTPRNRLTSTRSNRR